MKFIIESKKTKYEINKIMKENTSEGKFLFHISQDEFFKGEILEDSFKIRRKISYKNSFLPVINGSIEESDSGIKINIKTRLNFFVIVFACIWFIVALFDYLTSLFSFSKKTEAVLPFIMLIAGFLIIYLPYKYESNIAKEKLKELLE